MRSLPLVQLDNVSVSLSGRRILHDLNWRWQPGESWAVLGANGSGKSTFLRLIAGEVHPEPGGDGRRTYALNGEPAASAVGVREQVAFVSPEQQERYLNMEWVRTGRDVLLTGFHRTDYLYQRLTAGQRVAAAKVAEQFRLGPLLRRDVQTLSQGEFRRVLIARALLGRPKLLLLDEFTDGLDAAMRAGLLAAVQRAAESGTHVLLATHREDELLPALGRRLVLEGGSMLVAKGRKASPANHANENAGRWSSPLTLAPTGGEGRVRGQPASNANPSDLATASGLNLKRLPVHARSPDSPSPRPSPPMGAREQRAAARPASLRSLRPFAATDFLFRLRNVSVYRDRKAVLRNFNWEMGSGEHWTVTGPNGCGKSTFLKLLLGELHPALGGTIHRFGETRRHTLWEIRARVGYVGPDLQTAYRDELTAREVVASGWFASIGLMDAVTRAQWRRVDEVVEQFDLSELARENFLRLSYGQRRRVLLARAVVHRPQVLLLDEPLDGLDGDSLAHIREYLAEWNLAGTALVTVAHRPDVLARRPPLPQSSWPHFGPT